MRSTFRKWEWKLLNELRSKPMEDQKYFEADFYGRVSVEREITQAISLTGGLFKQDIN